MFLEAKKSKKVAGEDLAEAETQAAEIPDVAAEGAPAPATPSRKSAAKSAATPNSTSRSKRPASSMPPPSDTPKKPKRASK